MVLFYFEIATFTGAEGTSASLDLCYIKSTIPGKENLSILFVEVAPYLALILALGLFVNIFLFKKRKLQIMIGNVLFLLNLVFLVFMLMAPDKLLAELGDGSWDQHLGVGYYLPILSIVMIIWAIKAVKKDDQLVKAADRLR